MIDGADVATESAGPVVVRKRRRKWQGVRNRFETQVTRVLAAIAAVAAAFSNAEPAGLFVYDSLITAGFAVLITLASVRAKRWTLVWLVGIATAGAVGTLWVIPGVMAFIPLGILLSNRRRDAIACAVVGALAVQSVLNITPMGFSGLPSIVAALAVGPVLWSAYARSSERRARRIRNSALMALGASIIAVGIFGVAVMSARSKINNAVVQSENAMKALRAGDQDEAGALFEQATAQFESARSTLNAPWALPVRLVPIAGQNAKSLSAAASSGHALATSAAETATAAPYQQLRSSGGAIDIARIEAMQEPMQSSLATLTKTRSQLTDLDSPWLISPLRTRLDRFTRVVDDAIPQADIASATLNVLPELLGSESTKRYFIAFATPSETRFQGGFIGAYGELEASDGVLTLTRSGPIGELNQSGTSGRKLDGMKVYQDRYGRYHPALFLQNLTASPDFPSNAAAIANLYPQAGGQPIDGVIYVDPYGLAALLALTGPVEVEGLDFKLSSENAAKFLLVDQYLEGKTTAERKDALVNAAEATFSALTSRDLPSPSKITRALGPTVRGGNIAFTTFADSTNDYLERIGLTGAFIGAPSTDYLDVRVANAGGNKIDSFLSRVVDYRVEFDSRTGSVESVATIELTNAAPASGISDYVIGNLYDRPSGTNRLWLAVFTPLNLIDASQDDEVIPTESQHELGANVYSTLVSIPPGTTTTLQFNLRGSWPGSNTYKLTLGHQPLVNDDHVSITVSQPEGAPPVSSARGMEIEDSSAIWSGVSTEPMRFEVGFSGPRK